MVNVGKYTIHGSYGQICFIPQALIRLAYLAEF